MRVTIELDDEIGERLIQAHLRDSEAVARKIERLIEWGMKLDSYRKDKGKAVAVPENSLRNIQYLSNFEVVADFTVKNGATPIPIIPVPETDEDIPF